MATATWIVVSAGFTGGILLAGAMNLWDWWHDR